MLIKPTKISNLIVQSHVSNGKKIKSTYVVLKDKKAYFSSRNHLAALCAAATSRSFESVFDLARTHFQNTYGNSTIQLTDVVPCDRSSDIAPTWSPTLMGDTPPMINDDQIKKEVNLSTNRVVVYSSKPGH